MSAERGPEKSIRVIRIPAMTDWDKEISNEIIDRIAKESIAIGVTFVAGIANPLAGAIMGVEVLRQTYLSTKSFDEIKRSVKQKGIAEERNHQMRGIIALGVASTTIGISPLTTFFMLPECIRQLYLDYQKQLEKFRAP